MARKAPTPTRAVEKPKARKPAAPRPEPGSGVNQPAEQAIAPTLPVLAPAGLTPLEHRFCTEYPVDLNGTRAYLRASPGVTEETARTEAAQFLAKPRVRQEVQRLLDERSVRTGITADRVLTRLWTQATADHRELSEMRVGPCRHCWGTGHLYQFTAAEYQRALERHEQAEIKREKAEKQDFVPRQFDEKGGIGFDANRDPNPKCPECFGDGEPRAVIKDTRNLSPGAALLYAGVKQTKDGVEVKTHDQMRSIELVGRHLGMWNDNLKITPGAPNPLQALLEQIAASQGVTLPVVADDPETANRDRNEVVDVEAKVKPEKRKIQWQPLKKPVT